MAAVNSRMLPLGSMAPFFSLPDPDGNKHALADAEGAPATLVMFLSNHCPYVQHIRSELSSLCTQYMKQDVAVFAINSNDVEAYPADGPSRMKEEIVAQDYRFPYLLDEDQSVAKAYEAACTPDFSLFDGKMSLVYRGQFDGSRPGNSLPVTGDDLRSAIDAVLRGYPVNDVQTPSIGCSIKWKPGNEPNWAK